MTDHCVPVHLSADDMACHENLNTNTKPWQMIRQAVRVSIVHTCESLMRLFEAYHGFSEDSRDAATSSDISPVSELG